MKYAVIKKQSNYSRNYDLIALVSKKTTANKKSRANNVKSVRFPDIGEKIINNRHCKNLPDDKIYGTLISDEKDNFLIKRFDGIMVKMYTNSICEWFYNEWFDLHDEEEETI